MLILWPPCLLGEPSLWQQWQLRLAGCCRWGTGWSSSVLLKWSSIRRWQAGSPLALTRCGPAVRGLDSILFQLSLCNCSDSARTCQCVVDLRLISFEMEFWLNSSNRCCCKICFSAFLLKAILRGSFTTLPVVQSIHLITTYRLFSIKWRQQISSLNMTSLFCKTRFWKLKAIIFI